MVSDPKCFLKASVFIRVNPWLKLFVFSAFFVVNQGFTFCFICDNLWLHQSQLQFGRLGHHALVPGRVPDQLDVCLVNRFHAHEFVLHILRERRTTLEARASLSAASRSAVKATPKATTTEI